MSLVDRAKNILLTPKAEWPKIDSESTTTQQLFTGYAMILAAIPAVLGILIGLLFAGRFLGLGYFLVHGITSYLLGLGVLFLAGIAASALAPSFDGKSDQLGGLKTVVYSGTAVWLASIALFIPFLGPLIVLAGAGYSAYLLYLGCQTTLKIPEKNAVGFTAVIIIGWLVLGAVVFGLAQNIAWQSAVGSTYRGFL